MDSSDASTTPRVSGETERKATRIPSKRNGDAALFTRNLRLLDLDLLPDWPGITPQIYNVKFTATNQKERIRCTEWALYRLFELWDKKDTRTKLKPFFPPLVQLQSVNLRAALLRWLNDLKRDGILGRECILRKTMLDECRGDKFEEMLLLFSVAVLKKMTIERQQGSKMMSISKTLATAPMLSSDDIKLLLPMIVTQQASLSLRARSKELDRGRLRALELALASKESDTRRKMENTITLLDSLAERLVAANVDVDEMIKHICESWPDGNQWIDIILNVDGEEGRDHFLEDSFESIFNHATEGKDRVYTENTEGLVNDLNTRISQQYTRLEKWHSFQLQLSSRMQSLSQSPRKTPVRSTRNTPSKTSNTPLRKATRPLSMIDSPGLRVAAAKQMDQKRHQAPLLRHRSNSLSDTNPLDKLPVSPSKGFGSPLTSQSQARGKIRTPSPKKSMTVSTHVEADNIVMKCKPSSKINLQPSADEIIDPTPPETLHDMSMRANENPPLSKPNRPSKSDYLSLAERTQKSLALTNASRTHQEPPPKPTQPLLASSPTAAAKSTSTDRNNHSPDRGLYSLARTISNSSPPRRNLHQNSKSVNYPVNPLDNPPQNMTPRDPPTLADHIASRTPDSVGIATPPDNLFSEDADCASVFKSRPKVKLSPAASPTPAVRRNEFGSG